MSDDNTPTEESGENPRKPTKSHKRRLTLEQWQRVRVAICAGRRADDVAEAFGISKSAIEARGKREQWPTPIREKRKIAKALRMQENCNNETPNPPQKEEQDETKNTNSTSSNEDENTKFMSCIDRHVEALRVASDSDPETFEDAAGRLAQAMVAVGLATVQPPRTINEIAKWEDLRRKFQKRDAPQQLGGLFDPVRPMRRSTGHVVEAEPVEGDGFEI